MQTFDEAVPPLSQILAGGQMQPQPQQQPQGPGIIDGARNWFQANPQMATMVLGTMMAAAQGHDIGNAVATGAKMSLAQQAELKQKQETDQKEQEKLAREQAQLDQKNQMDQQRLDLDRQRTMQQGKVGDSQIGYYGAQTKELERKSAESRRNEDLQRQALQTRLNAIDEQIAASKDQRRTAVLQREKLRIENQIKREYGALEAETNITGKQLANEGVEQDNRTKLMTNASMDRDLRETANMTPEERASLGKGGGKAPKTEFDNMMDFMKNNGELYLDAEGNFDMGAMLEGYNRIKSMANPQAAAGSQGSAPDPAFTQRQAAARAKVKPGELYTVDGRTFRRGK